MDASSKPLVQSRRLRTELRTARQVPGYTQEQVARSMEWSLSKVIRIESGSVGVSANDLRALLDLYGIGSPERADELLDLARASRQSSVWSRRYKADISPSTCSSSSTRRQRLSCACTSRFFCPDCGRRRNTQRRLSGNSPTRIPRKAYPDPD